MTKRKGGLSGLDRERARRRKLDRLKTEVVAGEVVAAGGPEQNGEPLRSPEVERAGATPPSARPPHTPAGGGGGVRLPRQHVMCVWCGTSVAVKARGPVPRYCSATCRHRAWEQRRAARDGRAAVVAVDRVITVYPDDSRGWVDHLERLAGEVRGGRLDDALLSPALDLVHLAIAHRQRQHSESHPW